MALAGVAQWIEHGPVNQRVTIQFPVRAHTWVASQVPNKGYMRSNHTLIFLSLSFSLPSSLSKNKFKNFFKKRKQKEEYEHKFVFDFFKILDYNIEDRLLWLGDNVNRNCNFYL